MSDEQKNNSSHDSEDFKTEDFKKLVENRMQSNKSWNTNVFKREFLTNHYEKYVIDGEGVKKIEVKIQPEESNEGNPLEDEIRQEIEKESQEVLENAQKQAEEILSQAEKQAEEIIQQAEKQAEEILMQTQTESESVLQQAEEQGFQQGLENGTQQGLQEGNQHFQDVVQYFNSLNEELKSQRNSLMQEVENDFAEMVIASVETIVAGELFVNKDIIFRVLKECVQEVNEKGTVQICLNPQDIESIQKAKEQLDEILRSFENVRFVDDPALSKGSVRIETRSGNIEALIEDKIQVLYSSLEN